MTHPDISLYKELVDFCNLHQDEIETKFKKELSFNELNEMCYIEMFEKCRHIESPLPVKHFKDIIPGLTEAYKKNGSYFMTKRNEYIKGLDIQKGQWYEKALQLFLGTKGITVTKKGFPYPDFEISINDKVVGYYELKYIKSPFLTANSKIKNTFPYNSTRYDYEASLTLDTGDKLYKQRVKSEELIGCGYPVYYIWWYDCFHIKGLFAMHATEVYEYYDMINGNVHERTEREGDLECHQEKGKIYPPLLEMITFNELINSFKQ